MFPWVLGVQGKGLFSEAFAVSFCPFREKKGRPKKSGPGVGLNLKGLPDISAHFLFHKKHCLVSFKVKTPFKPSDFEGNESDFEKNKKKFKLDETLGSN